MPEPTLQPLVTDTGSPIPDQVAARESAFNFVIPDSTFAGVGDTLTYTATLEDGSLLPGWLAFNPLTQTFTGTPPRTESGIFAVKITATDAADSTSDILFNLRIGDKAIDLATGTRFNGNTGDDTYLFTTGAGKDVIIDSDNTPGNLDSIKITGIAPEDIIVKRSDNGKGKNLILSIKGNSADTLTIRDYFIGNGANRIEQVLFDDGTKWDAFQLGLKTAIVPTTSGNVYGTSYDDTFDLRNPANTNYAGGNDGNDTYVFGRGAGQDTIWTQANRYSTPSIVRMVGLSPSDVTLSRSDSDLIISIRNTNDQLVVYRHFDNQEIEQVLFDDGTVWDQFYLDNLGANNAPTFTGSFANQIAAEDSVFSVAIPPGTFADGGDLGDTLTYTATLEGGGALPKWLTVEPVTGMWYLYGTPGTEDVGGNLQIIITATDAGGLNISSNVFTLTVNDNTNAPTFTGSLANQIVTKGSAFTLAIPSGTFADIDDADTLTYTATQGNGSALPNWLVIDPATGALGNKSGSQVPAIDNLQIIIIATDSAGLSVSSNVFNLTVKAAGGEIDLTTDAANTIATRGQGNDTYLFTTGAGKDVIVDHDNTPGNMDSIKITGIAPEDIIVKRSDNGSGKDLILSIKGNSADTLTIRDYFIGNGANRIEQVLFDDGTKWDAFQLGLKTAIVPTTSGNVYGTSYDDTFDLRNPANTNYAGGNDGNDTYVFGRGAGQDTIWTQANRYSTPSIVRMVGLSPSDVTLSRSDSDLIISIRNTNDQLTVYRHFDNQEIEQVLFDDGTVWDQFYLDNLGANNAPTFTGSLADQTVAAGSSAFTFAIPSGTFADVDVGDTLTYTATQGNGSALPNWLVIDPATGALGNKSGSQVPAIDNLQIIIIATDSAGLSVSSNAFTLDVTNAPTFFTGDLANQIVTKGSAFTFAIPSGTFADIDDADTLTYTATQGNGSALPNWLVIDPATGALGNKSGSQVPAIDNLQIIIIATDSAGLSVSSNVFNLTVKAAGGEIDLTTDAANTIATRGQGNDTYLFTTGAGKDVIVDHDNTPGNMDTIKITGGVLPSDVTLRRLNHSLIISIRNTNDQLVVYKHFAADHKIEKVVFDNGTEWDAFQLGLATAIVPTTSGNVYGTSDDDTFDLRNPANTSHVRGGTGNDTYVFGRGAGKDRIADYGGSTSDVDTIKITGGVLPSDVTLRRLNHSLIISIRNTNDQLVVYKHFAADHKIEKVVFDNGTEWDAFQLGLATAIVPTTSGNVYGTSDDDTFDLRNPANTSHVRGGTGNDTYVFGRGAGKDRIADNGSTSDVDTIKITGGVLPSDVTLRRLNHSLIISIRNTNDQLVVYKHFAADHKIEKVVFDNGTEWGAEKLNAAAIRPGAGGETRGAEKLNVVATLPGAGSIQGTDGDDTYYDLRDPANSTTDDVSGNDTYRFAAGAGQDVIRDWGSTPNNNDTLEFLSGVDANQLWLRQDGNNLEVSIIGTNDKVTIEDWYSGSVYHIEEFTTSDGKTLMHTQVDNLVQAMAAFAPPASGETTLPDDYQRTLDPVIAANWQ